MKSEVSWIRRVWRRLRVGVGESVVVGACCGGRFRLLRVTLSGFAVVIGSRRGL